MVSLLYKWLCLFPLLLAGTSGNSPVKPVHPIFVSVTEVEYNPTDKTLEISCKLFTDDFEQTLRLHHSEKIDLLNDRQKDASGKMIAGYIQQHLVFTINGTKTPLQFIGFEQQEEGIISYFQAVNIAAVKNIDVFNDLLYELKPQQMGIIHATVNGQRKSNRVINPNTTVSFAW